MGGGSVMAMATLRDSGSVTAGLWCERPARLRRLDHADADAWQHQRPAPHAGGKNATTINAGG